MTLTRNRFPLSRIRVRWSQTEGAYLAWLPQQPDLRTRDPHSSLAALDRLLHLIEQSGMAAPG
ncbi:hypothetical protein [Nocardia sp. CDC160]|uniref:hypothetical protein n=1 Tax=Nocardia sp. CDC160 TaxID=3112166 RepID=UPI002DBCB721|nr:hypothetical protein [Nocardia sp. CDC160]MEC3916970.1 hypothetical protein [Nocardia sp. CDC160]